MKDLPASLRSSKTDPYIEGYRGLAILMVLIFHAFSHLRTEAERFRTPFNYVFYLFTDIGSSGVDFFFILSGFLITRVLIRSAGKRHYFRNFYVRRALRIFPLYYFVLALTLFVTPRLIQNTWYAENQIWFWTYLQNFAIPTDQNHSGYLTHFWSLAIEAQFYLIWPLLVFFLSPRRLRILGLLAIPGWILVRAMMIQSPQFNLTQVIMHTLTSFDRFILGATLAAALHLGFKIKPHLQKITTVFVFTLGVLVSTIFFNHHFTGRYLFFTTSMGLLGSTLLLLLLSSEKNFARTKFLFGNKWLQYLGAYSYGVYVIHLPLMYELFPHFQNFAVVFNVPEPVYRGLFLLGSLLLSVGLARISWILIEEPFLKLKNRFEK